MPADRPPRPPAAPVEPAAPVPVEPLSTAEPKTAAVPRGRPWVRLVAALAVAPVLRLAVARYAVPPGEPDRTGCPTCGTPLTLDRPWPALGPAARCPACRSRVGAPPGTVEVAVLAALAVLVSVGGSPGERAALAWWLGWAVPLVFVDAAVHRLPDRLTWPAAVGGQALLGLAALAVGPAPWLRAAAAGAGLALCFAATTLVLGRRGFGLGDAKLALGAGALLGWYGWPVLVLGVLVTFTLSALTSLALLLARRVRWSSHLPFGPFLVLGTVATLLLVR
ncbi:Type IV leader peptidase family protein [Micromonospora sp. MW-13]|uniref:prepilin peptidase n=1 Tax=unclassified Micromonospora TaxID=2617518 RepID=UPI000EB9B288|nr:MULTISPECIES: A24 family peptidase [unclassified Micromonospora]MCX4468921.1 A24 family peptidase [Micromonospora sp. NBC_01655]RGC68978.1 Type IV leader peptidase family protein [Micromonospora sp. MW-13]